MAAGNGGRTSAEEVAAAQAMLDQLGSRPRPAGSEAEAAARAHAQRHLESLGFTVTAEPFAYSAFPGRWATSLSGVAAMGVIGVAGHLGAMGSPGSALTVLGVGTALIGLTAAWMARRGVLDAPAMRREGINLVARRPSDADQPQGGAESHTEPAVWLMAHLDSKSQPVPILVRAAAITLSAVLFVAAGILAAAQAFGVAGAEWWPALTVATWVALLPVAASVVAARSDGTIDNASGCAAVLLAANRLATDSAVGVILTSAEELGLAGGRAFARQHRPATCINCDGVDDDGRWTAMYTGSTPTALLDAASRAASRTSIAVQPRRLLPGVLVDGVALADAGWQVITISHGSVATLGRIHTRRDSRARLRGDAIAAAAMLIATTVEEVR